MWMTIVLALMGFTHQVLAQDFCADINPRRLQLAIHAMNLANVITTRTQRPGFQIKAFLPSETCPYGFKERSL